MIRSILSYNVKYIIKMTDMLFNILFLETKAAKKS